MKQRAMTNRRVERSWAGFTLAELLVTVALVGILAAGTVPSMAQLIANNRMASRTNTFLTAIHLARSEAVKRGVETVICPSIDGDTCADSTRWHPGLIAFIDENDNGVRDDNDLLLQVFHPQRAITMTSSAGRKRIKFQPSGTAGGSNLTMKLCAPDGHVQPQVICVSNTGRPRLLDTACDGSPIDCGS